jgi:hypothetical protein
MYVCVCVCVCMYVCVCVCEDARAPLTDSAIIPFVPFERHCLCIPLVDPDGSAQGNGLGRDKLKLHSDKDVFILDAFNPDIYPGARDTHAQTERQREK